MKKMLRGSIEYSLKKLKKKTKEWFQELNENICQCYTNYLAGNIGWKIFEVSTEER